MIDELSIVIPALNEENYLPKLLDSIAQQDFQGKLQVVVVDGGSDDKTVELAKNFKEKIPDLEVLQRHRGVAYQRNQGAEKAKYPYLLFLDSDIILPKKFLNRMVKKLNSRENFISFTLHLPPKFNFLDYCFVAIVFTFIFTTQFFNPVLAGSYIFTTLKNHQKINGFDEAVKLGEDIDYLNRSLEKGAKYHLFFFPFVFTSPRRLRMQGRIGLLKRYVEGMIHFKKYGAITDEKAIDYPMGNRYKGED